MIRIPHETRLANSGTPERLIKIVCEEADQSAFALCSIRGPWRCRKVVEVRRRIAKRARMEDFTFEQIGRALNRDHSSVVSLLRSRKGGE